MPPDGLATWFPPPPIGDAALEMRLANGAAIDDARCPVCGLRGPISGFTDNIRESGHCAGCGAWTRIRQMATVLVEVAAEMAGRSIGSIDELSEVDGLRIYNTEAHGSLHERLRRSSTYVASEYFGPDLASGELGPGGTLHQDLQCLSFESGSLDLVISTDVFEHVADPYLAHREVHRILRPGGRHVFTVPYREDSSLDEVRAAVSTDGSVQLLAEPLYHDDPVRTDEGALVFTIFGLEMLVKLARIGFETTVFRLWDPGRGLVGSGFVFDAVRSPG